MINIFEKNLDEIRVVCNILIDNTETNTKKFKEDL